MSSETDDTGSYYDAVGEMAAPVEDQDLGGRREEAQGWDDDAVAAATDTGRQVLAAFVKHAKERPREEAIEALQQLPSDTVLSVALVGTTLAMEIEDYKDQLARADDKLGQAEDKLAQANQRIAELEAAGSKAQEFESRCRDLEQRADTYRRDYQELDSKMGEARQQIETLREQLVKARRGTMFESPAGDDERRESATMEGGNKRRDENRPRRRTTMLISGDSRAPMTEAQLVEEFFRHARDTMPGDRPVDEKKMLQRQQSMTKGAAKCRELAETAGVSLKVRMPIAEPLTDENLSKLISKVVGAVKAEKYASRSDWKDMQDVNRKLCGIFGKPLIGREALARALRAEAPEDVIEVWNHGYNQAIEGLPDDVKKAESVKKILTVRQQDQDLLAAALEELLAEHSAQLAERIRSRKNDVITVTDLNDKGFAIMTLAEVILDQEHVDKHVTSLFDLIAYPDSFEGRFFGNLANYAEKLREELDRFEQTTGVIDRDLVHRLLVIKVLTDSKAKPMEKYRSHIKQMGYFRTEMRSIEQMHANFSAVFENACTWQRDNFTELYHKDPLTALEWSQVKRKKQESTHFVKGDSQEICPKCLTPHPPGPCRLDINVKRVVDEAQTVLSGHGETIKLGESILAALKTGKDADHVKAPLAKFVDLGKACNQRLSEAMKMISKRGKTAQKAHHADATQAVKSEESVPVKDAVGAASGENLAELVHATLQSAFSQAAAIAGKTASNGWPSRLCYQHAKGGCTRTNCPWDHPPEYKGVQKTKDNVSTTPPPRSSTGQALPDGPITGTTCAQCNQKPCYRESGKEHKYCSRTCAVAAGAHKGKKEKTHVTFLEPNEPDEGSQLLLAAGYVPLGDNTEYEHLTFTAVPGAPSVAPSSSICVAQDPPLLQHGTAECEEFYQALADSGLMPFSQQDQMSEEGGERLAKMKITLDRLEKQKRETGGSESVVELHETEAVGVEYSANHEKEVPTACVQGGCAKTIEELHEIEIVDETPPTNLAPRVAEALSEHGGAEFMDELAEVEIVDEAPSEISRIGKTDMSLVMEQVQGKNIGDTDCFQTVRSKKWRNTSPRNISPSVLRNRPAVLPTQSPLEENPYWVLEFVGEEDDAENTPDLLIGLDIRNAQVPGYGALREVHPLTMRQVAEATDAPSRARKKSRRWWNRKRKISTSTSPHGDGVQEHAEAHERDALSRESVIRWKKYQAERRERLLKTPYQAMSRDLKYLAGDLARLLPARTVLPCLEAKRVHGPLHVADEQEITEFIMDEARLRAHVFFEVRGMSCRRSSNWTRFWRNRARRNRRRRFNAWSTKLKKLRTKEERVLASESLVEKEVFLANEWWARMTSGELPDQHWYDSWEAWANNFWSCVEEQEAVREQKERLEAIDRLLSKLDELSPDEVVHDDVWDTLGLADVGPEEWKREVQHMDLQAEYTAARRRCSKEVTRPQEDEPMRVDLSDSDSVPGMIESSDDENEDDEWDDLLPWSRAVEQNDSLAQDVLSRSHSSASRPHADEGESALAEAHPVENDLSVVPHCLQSRKEPDAERAMMDEDPEATRQDNEQLRLWWPLSTAGRLHGRTLADILAEERRSDRCFLEMEAGKERPQVCDTLANILRCFKISAPDGKIPLLFDSGSTCLLSPYREHSVVRIGCTTGITGIGEASATEYSPCVLGGVDKNSEYHMIHLPRMYRLDSLDVAILSGPTLEKAGYRSYLSASSSYLTAPDGTVVPLVRDPGTGFHFFIDHVKAEPVLRAKSALVEQFSKKREVEIPNPYKLEEPESKPCKPDTAQNLDASLRSHFGAEIAWPLARTKPDSRDVCQKTRTLVWAKIGKHFWPARIAVVDRAPPKVREARKPDTVLVHFFDNWARVRQDPHLWMYEWVSDAKLASFEENFDKYSKSHKSKQLAPQIRDALSLDSTFRPDGWDVKLASDPYDTGITPDLPTKPGDDDLHDRGGHADGGENVTADVSDDQYFREFAVKQEKDRTDPIRLRMPPINLNNTGVPKQLQHLRTYLHELLGHFGWAKIKEVLPYLGSPDLVKLIEQVMKLPKGHCAGCVEGKSTSVARPRGKTARPPHPVKRPDKLYMDIVGRIEEPSAGHNYHYALTGITSSGLGVMTGLSFRSQAVLGSAKLFNQLGGAPKTLQVDGEGNLNTEIALNYFQGARECEVITTAAGAHFRNGAVERFHQTIKGCARALLFRSGLSLRYWYHAMQHAVLLYNMLTLATDAQGNTLQCTVWEHHYGTKPDIERLLLGPFGCLSYLILSEEQRRARGLCGHFGMRALSGIYLGCTVNPKTGVFDHLITDGRSIFSSPNQVKCIPDVYPMHFSAPQGTSLIPHHAEDLQSSREGEEVVSFAVEYERCWNAAKKKKAREEQEKNEFIKKGGGRRTRLQGDERKYGKNKKRPFQIVSEKEGPLTRKLEDMLNEMPEIDDEINMEDPRDYILRPLRDDYCFEEPYKDAKYSLVVPVDFTNEKLVDTVTKHPHLRFVGRKIRRIFEVDDATKKKVSRKFEGKVLSYTPERQLFKVIYSDNTKEDLDFHELMQVLVMGKCFGDQEGDWGKTRAERDIQLRSAALLKEAQAQVNIAMVGKIDRAYERWFEREKVFRATDEIVSDGTMPVPVPSMLKEPIYDDEPKTDREVEKHPEKEDIRAAAWKEIQQLIEMSVGVMLNDDQARKVEKDPAMKILRSKMVYKRKYQISPVDGKEYFLKWKARLAAVGSGQEPGVDTVWNTFSPTIGFTAIRTLIATMCNPKWHVDSYDLSGAYLGTKLEDQAVYMRLPSGAGEYSNKVLRLTRNIYGLKGASKAFMNQLGQEIEKFAERVEATDPKNPNGPKRVTFGRFERLITDQCMYRYRDELGREMIFASYVDDIICCTTDRELRDRFFDHLRKTWAVTHEGTLDRFLGIHFERSKDGWTWSATMSTYIEKIAKRFGLEECRKVTTPMEPGFTLTEEDFADEPSEEMVTEIRSLIGSIGYCATALRYDVSYAVSVLSRHLARPCEKVIEAAKRIIKYLWWTKDFAVKWTSSQLEEEQETANVIVGAVDASFAMDTMSRKSHGGFINFVNNGAVSWKSGLQSIVTLSSCEAEYVALCSEVCEVKYLRSLMRELGHKQRESTLIWEDNKAAILIAENECSSAGRSKHIDVRFKFVAQAIAEEAVRVRYTPTDMNLADLLTKALPTATFERLLRRCVGNKRGEYFDNVKGESVNLVREVDDRGPESWMTTTLWETG